MTRYADIVESEAPLNNKVPAVPLGFSIARLKHGLGWLTAAGLLALYLAMLRRYAVDFPWADDFSQLLAVPQYIASAHTAVAKLGELFAFSAEHRIVALRLAALLQAHLLGGIDFRALMYFGSALVVVPGILVMSIFDRAHRPLAAPLTAALLFSPANYGAAFWANGALQHLGGVAYAFAAIYCVSRAGLMWQLGAAVLALAAALSSAGGLMVFPVAIFLLGLERRWRPAIMWAFGTVALFCVYFIGYETPPHQASLTTYLHDPLLLPRFFLMAVGSLGRSTSMASVAGFGICFVWLWLVTSGRMKTVPREALGWIAFILLSFAAITWGRAGFGEAGAVISRYRVYSELALLVTLAALLTQISHRAGTLVLAAALPFALGWCLLGWRYDLPDLERFSMDRRNELDYYVAEGHNPPAESLSPEFRDFMLKVAQARGYYDPTRLAAAPRDLLPATRSFDTSHPLKIEVEPPLVGRRTVLIRVQAPGFEKSALLWLQSENHQYRGGLKSPPVAPLGLGRGTGLLWGFYTLSSLAPGTYRVGVAVNDDPVPPMVWSNQTITVE